ncbi:MAG: hypothetical protein MJ174_09665 [Treponema sp.]|nr:hypothetical protein [Treponema sp.]
MGVASLVLGIISLVSSVVGGVFSLGWVGSICGVIAIVLGVLAKKDAAQAGKGKAGMICGIIALAWGVISTVACIACAACAYGAAEGYLNSLM